MHSIISSVSILELCTFIVGMLLFFSSPPNMAYIFLHFAHPIRGFIGLLVIKKMPKSNEIVAKLEIENTDKIKFAEFRV